MTEEEEVERRGRPPEGLSFRGLLFDFLVEEMGSPGRMLPTAAMKAPCRCVTIPGAVPEEMPKRLCNREGFIGMLTQDQMSKYCSDTSELPDGRRERVLAFREAARVCKTRIAHIPKGEKLEPWLDCMGEELTKAGIEVR